MSISPYTRWRTFVFSSISICIYLILLFWRKSPCWNGTDVSFPNCWITQYRTPNIFGRKLCLNRCYLAVWVFWRLPMIESNVGWSENVISAGCVAGNKPKRCNSRRFCVSEYGCRQWSVARPRGNLPMTLGVPGALPLTPTSFPGSGRA